MLFNVKTSFAGGWTAAAFACRGAADIRYCELSTADCLAFINAINRLSVVLRMEKRFFFLSVNLVAQRSPLLLLSYSVLWNFQYF